MAVGLRHTARLSDQAFSQLQQPGEIGRPVTLNADGIQWIFADIWTGIRRPQARELTDGLSHQWERSGQAMRTLGSVCRADRLAM